MRAGQINLVDLELPILVRPSAPVSDEDLMRFSEKNKPFKIERNKKGELIVMTPVGFIGGTHEGYIAAKLLLWAEQDARGTAVPANVGFKLPDGSCLAPDAAWVLQTRLDALTSQQRAGYPPLCPDFLIEVRSQSDTRKSVEDKMQLWLENGAKLAWLVDPIDANVTIYRPGQAPENLNRPEVVLGEGPVQGFKLPCMRLWPAQ
jgi:Uma2 family endonuclease